jgi:hypothetical protein
MENEQQILNYLKDLNALMEKDKMELADIIFTLQAKLDAADEIRAELADIIGKLTY